MQPTIGRIVLYTLGEADAAAINKRRADFMAFQQTLAGAPESGHVAHVGNHVDAGNVYPAVVVRAFGGPAANLKVLLDGTDDYWATSRSEGDAEGQWAWPARA